MIWHGIIWKYSLKINIVKDTKIVYKYDLLSMDIMPQLLGQYFIINSCQVCVEFLRIFLKQMSKLQTGLIFYKKNIY